MKLYSRRLTTRARSGRISSKVVSRFACRLGAVALLVANAAGVSANPFNELKTSLNQFLTRKSELAELDEQRRTVALEIRKLKDHERRAADQIERLEKELVERRAALSAARSNEAQAAAAHTEALALLRQISLAVYRQGRPGPWRVWLDPARPLSGTLRRAGYLEYWHQSQMETLARIQTVQASYTQAAREAKQAMQREAVVAKRLQREAKRLEIALARQRLLAKRLDSEYLTASVGLKEEQPERSSGPSSTSFVGLNAGSRRVSLTSAQIPSQPDSQARNSSRRFKETKGQLRWPVVGSLGVSFGSVRGAGRWDGVVLSAPEGGAVRAVHSGTVAFSGSLPGYGLMTIVDHGDGFMSLYAYNQSLLKSVGDFVAAGEVITKVGRLPDQRTAGLYFGIREHGKPVDPAYWCTGSDS